MIDRRIAAALVVLGGIGACEPLPLGDGPRRTAIKALAREVIVPELEDFEASAHALEAAVRTSSRAEQQAAWRTARAAWKRLEPLSLGPAADQRLAARIDQSPVDPEQIFELARTATLTAENIAELGANKVGFHALEALLFAGDGSARQASLAGALAAVLAADATRLASAWSDEYLARFTEIGAANAAFATAGDAVDAVVNAIVSHAEKMMALRLGGPLGHASGGQVAPELAESPLADGAIDDLLANLEGLERIYRTALSPLVSARSQSLDGRVLAAITALRSDLLALPRPFATALADHTAAVEATYSHAHDLWVVLGTEVVGALGAVLKFDDSDGD